MPPQFAIVPAAVNHSNVSSSSLTTTSIKARSPKHKFDEFPWNTDNKLKHDRFSTDKPPNRQAIATSTANVQTSRSSAIENTWQQPAAQRDGFSLDRIHDDHLQALLKADYHRPLQTTVPPAEKTEIYGAHTIGLKIHIAIPTSCSAKESNLRTMQRSSWFRYLDDSNALWTDMHATCEFDVKYYVGECDDDEQAFADFGQEAHDYGDIVQINVSEHWDNLQAKTIELLRVAAMREKENAFDLLLKTDTDSYVNLPNLCNFMRKLMNWNSWNASAKALYLGVLRDDTEIEHRAKGGKYENKDWVKRVRGKRYLPFMAGFGYFLSYKTTQIVGNALATVHVDDLAFNRLEDTYLGHLLSAFNVKYVDIGDVIDPYMQPTVDALNNLIIDHWYRDSAKAVLMIDKYKTHEKVHQHYLQRQQSALQGYNPRLLLV